MEVIYPLLPTLQSQDRWWGASLASGVREPHVPLTFTGPARDSSCAQFSPS